MFHKKIIRKVSIVVFLPLQVSTYIDVLYFLSLSIIFTLASRWCQIPGQRVLGLHVISNVLDKALLNTHLTQVGSTMIKNRSSVDYNAIWAYILGPEPELALSLR